MSAAEATETTETTEANETTEAEPTHTGPVAPIEGPAGTAGLSDAGGGSSRFPGRPVQEIAFPTRDQYVSVVEEYHRNGFEMCADLCGVDYLTHFNRHLPAGVIRERFEVVVNLLSLSTARRVRLRVQLPESDLVVGSIFNVYPGVEAMEREAFDMFGIIFDGHPDLTRILMPEDWEGHPLRKDYGVGRVPVQFKGAPGPR
ncbi:MAG TPA: NADH-quinone oxidoreductase subunit C [Acidimicrobiales bacterium]|nr:NADH-quinone oxidoreductase subunit C [Acidimicrobiales bacterium]